MTQSRLRNRRQSWRPRFTLIILAAAAIGCVHRAPLDRTASGQRQGTPLAVRRAKVDAILQEQRLRPHIPGLAFAIVKDDQNIYLKAFDERNLERRTPATPDTLFPIGSCTKAFTSMAVAVSQDRGQLSLV
ncbi:serine hydrolase [Luteitalea pratensis]|uniref:serine hydrolase domain-containing protein n=1 Tax=Luteitalea pratensis TaxID=1855912 RepID=UPI000D7259C7